jgi:hypothetical protein
VGKSGGIGGKIGIIWSFRLLQNGKNSPDGDDGVGRQRGRVDKWRLKFADSPVGDGVFEKTLQQKEKML